MLKRPHYLALGAVGLLALILLNLPPQTSSRLKLWVGTVFLPMFGLAGSAQRAGEAVGPRVLSKAALIRQIEELRSTNDILRLEVMQLRETARENAILRDAVGWQRQSLWKTRLARVVTRDPANWWRSIQIDLGSKDGIAKNMPVVAGTGLVGRVDEVGLNFARVLLIGDPNCRVSALLDNPSRDTGIIAPGEGSVLDQSIVEITYLSRQSKVETGQRVFTSGLGGVFPKGIPIGTVLDVSSANYGLYLEARVKLSADLSQLEEVFVILP